MATPHAIHEEFPNDSDTIHQLKLDNTHFAKLLQEYDDVNDEVAAAESLQKPTAPEHENELRKVRARLKDEIARMIAAAKA